MPPVTPPAPCTSTVCPARTSRAVATVWPAVSAGTGSAAAESKDIPGGTRATSSPAAMNCSAQAPCSRSGSECTVTRSPTLTPAARSPTAATNPAASTPRAIGGERRDPSRLVRANSSQLPTPHACTSSRTSSGRSARGPGSSSSSIGPPIWRTPAALTVPLLPGTPHRWQPLRLAVRYRGLSGRSASRSRSARPTRRVCRCGWTGSTRGWARPRPARAVSHVPRVRRRRGRTVGRAVVDDDRQLGGRHNNGLGAADRADLPSTGDEHRGLAVLVGERRGVDAAGSAVAASPCALMVAWSSPSAPWYQAPASPTSMAAVMAAAGTAVTLRWLMSVPAGFCAGLSRSRSAETAFCVRTRPCSSRLRWAAISSLRAGTSGAARMPLISSIGVSSSRNRRMTCAAGIWSVV